MDSSQIWYLLKKSDENIYGPVPLAQLREWAAAAQISPMDRLSPDRTQWIKAPMLPELEMDWLIQTGADELYGPTTMGTVQEFLNLGEIGMDAVILNCKDGTEHRISELHFEVVTSGAEEVNGKDKVETEAKSIYDLSDVAKIVLLEKSLQTERQAREELWARHERLRQLYKEATGREPEE